jgi:hypothetical protein
MINEKIESFLEKTDMNYLFCLLAKMESHRLSQFPVYVRNHFEDKIPVMSMSHVAENDVPDYITELAEAELEMAKMQSPFGEEDVMDLDSEEETFDDSKRFIEELGTENLDELSDDDEDEYFTDGGDNDED